MKPLFSFTLAILLLASCAVQKKTTTLVRPIFEFGSSMEETKALLEAHSDSIIVKRNQRIQVPTAKKEQSQLDVYGYEYAGKKRIVELIFADNVLDIAWILTEADEEAFFIQHFKSKYGKPTHVTGEATFFINDRVAVRNNPHEVLYISERLVEQYKQFLENQ
ncbi:MAG: hypothetical protein R2825_23315 [Saprospiraceae bacterium]